jgi:hypothetical protein
MSGTFIFEVGQDGVWTFAARIGDHAGLGEHATGRAMTLACTIVMVVALRRFELGRRRATTDSTKATDRLSETEK